MLRMFEKQNSFALLGIARAKHTGSSVFYLSVIKWTWGTIQGLRHWLNNKIYECLVKCSVTSSSN